MQFKRVLGKMINIHLISEVFSTMEGVNNTYSKDNGYTISISYDVHMMIGGMKYTTHKKSAVNIPIDNSDLLRIFYEEIDKEFRKQIRHPSEPQPFDMDYIYNRRGDFVRSKYDYICSMHRFDYNSNDYVMDKTLDSLLKHLNSLDKYDRDEIVSAVSQLYFDKFMKESIEEDFIAVHIIGDGTKKEENKKWSDKK
ncbi:MAG: hypothetical protein ACRCRT_03000 [Cetobacterium somerae]